MAVSHSAIHVQFMHMYVASPIELVFSDGLDVSGGTVPLVASPFRIGFGTLVFALVLGHTVARAL